MGFGIKKTETKNWPHKIIGFLYDHYSETTTELNRFCYEKLEMSNDNTTHKDKLKDILIALEEKQYITWKVIETDLDGNWINANYKESFIKEPQLTLRKMRVEAQLTIDGLDYAIELERERIKHNIYIVATPLGTLFAFLAFTVSFATCINNCSKTEQQAPKVEVLLSPQLLPQKSKEDTMRKAPLPTPQPSETKKAFENKAVALTDSVK